MKYLLEKNKQDLISEQSFLRQAKKILRLLNVEKNYGFTLMKLEKINT